MTTTPTESKLDLDILEFNRKNIESLSSKISIFDSTPELDLFCYINCKNSDHAFIKQCHGVIFSGDKEVLRSFPYTTEYTEDDENEIFNTFGKVFDECSFYKAYEGCLIRVFNFNDKWYVSTNKKLNAFRSMWASKKSYGTFFEESLRHQFETNQGLRKLAGLIEAEVIPENVIELLTDKVLTKENQYMFLLLNNSENRIVCDEPENASIFHVGTFVEGKLFMNDDIGIAYPEKLTFKNLDEMYKYVDEINYNKAKGVIAFAPTNFQYMVLNKKYNELYKARNNEPSIKFRYLQCRLEPDMVDMLEYLYPDKKKDFEEYENYIFDASLYIYKSYVNRYIKRIPTTIPREEYNIMKEAHSWYLEDRNTHKIGYEKIIEILNIQKPTYLNKIIKRMKLNAINGEREYKIPLNNQRRLLPLSAKKEE